MKKILLLLRGLPGAGKSAYANNLSKNDDGWRRLSWDDLRKEIPGYNSHMRFNKQREKRMVEHSRFLVRNWAANGFNVAIDNTNLNPKTVNDWQGLAEELDMEFRIHDVGTPRELCIYQDRLRPSPGRVGQAVIDRMALTYGLLHVYSESVIVDMDGTLADSSKRVKYVNGICSKCSGTRWLVDTIAGGGHEVESRLCDGCGGTGHVKKDWGRFFGEVGNDETNPFVEKLVRSFSAAGHSIVIVSGRPINQAGIATEDWLIRKGIPFHALLMRQSGDQRDDTIVKKEILDKLPKDKIFCAIDDRPRIVKMWKENGVNVIDVGNGIDF